KDSDAVPDDTVDLGEETQLDELGTGEGLDVSLLWVVDARNLEPPSPRSSPRSASTSKKRKKRQSTGVTDYQQQAAEQQQQEQQKQGMRQEKTSDRSDEVSKDDHGDGANAGGDAGKEAVERVGGPAAKAAVEQTRNVQQSRKEAVVGEALEQSTGGDHVEDIAEGGETTAGPTLAADA
ncbi:unnamed protein product, partial [Sphacelaria rigidula]